MKNFYYHLSELTEITEHREQRPQTCDETVPFSDAGSNTHGWILYDGTCRYCIAAAKRLAHIFGRRGFAFLPLQTPWVQRWLELLPGEPLTEMRVLTVENRDFGGGNAVLFLARQVWWLWPFSVVGRWPGMHRVVDAAYRWIAAHRGCMHLKCDRSWRDELGPVDQSLHPDSVAASPRRGATCISYPTKARRHSAVATTKPLGNTPDLMSSHQFRDETSSSLQTRIVPWIALIILPALALITRAHVAAWAFMWVMAGAIFLGCKWLTLWRVMERGCITRVPRVLAYLFLWAGMDAESFLAPRGRREPLHWALPKLGSAMGKIAFGAVLLFGVARLVGSELLAGWIGMTGIIFILHFGIFDFAAICWRIVGITARPIMDAPLRSTSLTEFWGRRWNGAFNQLVIDIFFRRFARSFGTVRATLAAFLISGLIHELVISLPAGAGYGLPTSYFLLQGWGVIAQRTPIRGRVWFRRDTTGRIFTFVLVSAPAFWLFHPAFVRGVIIPFMQAIGAL